MLSPATGDHPMAQIRAAITYTYVSQASDAGTETIGKTVDAVANGAFSLPV